MELEGYSEYTTTKRSCGLCKWLKTEMIRSGRNPWRRSTCNHPKVKEERASISALTGDCYRDGRYIGEKDLTPLWCPVGKKKD